MPSGPISPMPYVLFAAFQYRPASLLELGIGFGKWGHVFREYLEITQSFDDYERYKKENWTIRIDGIEGFEPYITDAHRYIYTNIYIGDFCKLIKTADTYDVIFMGDVLEHVPKEKAYELLDDCLAKSNKAVILTTPMGFCEQGDACGNEFERHQSGWVPKDFDRFEHKVVKLLEGNYLLVILTKPGVEVPILNWHYHQQPMPPFRRFVRKWMSRLLGWKLFTKLDNWNKSRIRNPST
ncbi:MAG: hypothetical protein WD768_20110 [Phycisphaeraceae bacterium]